MTKKILSFEEYAASKNFTSNDDIAEENEELCETCEKDPCICESSEDDEDETEDDDKESDDDESDDDDEDESDDDDDDESDDDDDEESEDTKEVEDNQPVKPVAEQLKQCYEAAIKEACDYDKDEYPDHTLESYLKENCSMIASMGSNTLEQAFAELKDEPLEKETYEAILNDMKESYIKKIEELKEAWSAK
jgi:hypothetical protein